MTTTHPTPGAEVTGSPEARSGRGGRRRKADPATAAVDAAADLADFEETPATGGGYVSPVMRRLAGESKLTLTLLAEQVPLLHEGAAAKARLDGEEKLTAAERRKLRAAVDAGERAKDALTLAGIPLVRHLALKEHQRRQAWQSSVSVEDLFQDGSAGLLRGLMAYKVDGANRSATNYLGQWIVVEMRRQTEWAENDFAVGTETSERFRKIRALRSRLISELDREPTEEEMIAASTDLRYANRGHMGRVANSGKVGKALTAKQIREEREASSRVGQTARYMAPIGDDDSGDLTDHAQGFYAPDATNDAGEIVAENSTADGLARVIGETLNIMGLPDLQRDMIARRFGLPPHLVEQAIGEIVKALAVQREKVEQVIDAFQTEMTRTGGAFHLVCSKIGDDQLADLGLGWVVTTLGAYTDDDGATTTAVSTVLTGEIERRRKAPPPPPSAVNPRRLVIRAQFGCDYHGTTFVGVYETRGSVPKRRDCPQCGRPSDLVRVVDDHT